MAISFYRVKLTNLLNMQNLNHEYDLANHIGIVILVVTGIVILTMVSYYLLKMAASPIKAFIKRRMPFTSAEYDLSNETLVYRRLMPKEPFLRRRTRVRLKSWLILFLFYSPIMVMLIWKILH